MFVDSGTSAPPFLTPTVFNFVLGQLARYSQRIEEGYSIHLHWMYEKSRVFL